MSKTTGSKCVFIGGIGGGVGSALARRLKEQGHTVGGFGRSSDRFAKFREEHSGFDLYEADATDPKAVEKAVSGFAETQGSLDAYVHAVGTVFLKPLHMTTDDDWRGVQATNLDSAFYAARAAVNIMRKQRSGVVVFFSSVAAVAGLSNHEAIGAAKGGISGLVRSIAASYASNGIRANAIAPGLVETPATTQLTSSDQARALSERMHPVGRIGTAGDVSALAAWMLSDEAGWMTGQVVSLDGGMGSIVPKPRA